MSVRQSPSKPIEGAHGCQTGGTSVSYGERTCNDTIRGCILSGNVTFDNKLIVFGIGDHELLDGFVEEIRGRLQGNEIQCSVSAHRVGLTVTSSASSRLKHLRTCFSTSASVGIVVVAIQARIGQNRYLAVPLCAQTRCDVMCTQKRIVRYRMTTSLYLCPTLIILLPSPLLSPRRV